MSEDEREKGHSESVADIAALGLRVREELSQVVVGMDDAVRLALATILAGGHVLFEDVPGLGKTLLARSLAATLGLDFRRLQCTPDLMPGDVTGSSFYSPGTGDFVFREGPIFTGLLLADEINRTTPKTQSAMLEAMAEHQVTVEGKSLPLPTPFHVIATSNPIEYEGTYALPEAQLDRFMVRLAVGYPDSEEESDIVLNRLARRSPDARLWAVISSEELLDAQRAVEEIHVDADVVRYAVDLARATRGASGVAVGASPRGSQALVLLARAVAALDGRDYVRPDDIKSVAVATLAHRLTLTAQAWAQGVDPSSIVAAVVSQTPVPAAVSSSV